MEEEEANRMYEDIVKFCRDAHTSHFDYSFPPDNASIGDKVANGANQRLDHPIEIMNLYWLNPHQIEDEDDEEDYGWSIFNNPQPSDVIQSSVIGNCSIISSMAVIAERPDILDGMFPSKEISLEGVYRVRLHINGEWKTIIVDDYFPCYMHSGKLATAIGKRKQLWVPLIEKAMAKVMGGYSVLAEGSGILIPLSILTGADCVHYSVPDKPEEIELFWHTLMSSYSSGFLICCSSPKEKRTIRDNSVAENHAFSILALNDEHQNRLLRVRNPWGHTQWTGKWSNDWDGWPVDMKEKLLIDEGEDDGAFWIELDDFMELFESVAICKTRHNWHQFHQEITIGLDTPTVRFTVTEACEASFSATWKIPESTNSIDLMLSIHRISEDNTIGKMVGRSDRLSLALTFSEQFHLTPGEYIIMFFNLKNMNKLNIPRILVCYSSKPIFHELIPQTPQMFNHALRQIVLKDGVLKTDTPDGVFIRGLAKQFDGNIIMIDNYHSDKYFHFKNNVKNCETIRSSRGPLLTIDVIPPRSYQIIAIFSDIQTPATFSRRHSLQSEKFIDTDDEEICSQNLQHYPVIDPLDPIHYPQSIFYDLEPVIERKEKCQKRFKHFLWLCDCRG